MRSLLILSQIEIWVKRMWWVRTGVVVWVVTGVVGDLDVTVALVGS